jgi:hypothetical protein
MSHLFSSSMLQATCGETCPPCRDKCILHCGHRPCFQPCSAPCTECQSPCRWTCRHHSCDLKCYLPCTRPPCNVPCSNILPCGHRCVGLCGEPCVPWCAICNQAVSSLSNVCFRGVRVCRSVLWHAKVIFNPEFSDIRKSYFVISRNSALNITFACHTVRVCVRACVCPVMSDNCRCLNPCSMTM